MTVILFLLSFFIVYFNAKIINKTAGALENILISTVFFSILIVLSTELLSIFHLLTYYGLSFFWLTICILGVSKIYKNKSLLIAQIKLENKDLFSTFKQFSLFYKAIIICIPVLLSLVFLQGILYPPNNWDSMTYHLPRIMHWIQNGSVENYPTHIERQLYQPLFVEYVILHVNLLFDSDLLSNTVQFFYLILTSITVVGILGLFDISKNIKLIAFILCFTLPEALLQASSTQNDLGHSFYILTSIYFAIKYYKNLRFIYLFIVSSSIGFALLTKAIAYIYAPIIILFFALFLLKRMLKEQLFKKMIYHFLLAIIPIVLINLGHSYRNYLVTDNILGTTPSITEGIVFDKTSPKIIVSSCLKNMALHYDTYFVKNLGNKITEKAHLLMNFDINEKGTNVFDMKFNAASFWKNHEDTQANFIHFILFSICVFLFLFQWIKSRKLDIFLFSLVSLISLQFILFCAYLCWEPWNTRLHLPLFYEIIVFIALVLANIKLTFVKLASYVVLPLLIYYGFYLVIFNFSRPFVTVKDGTSKVRISDDRYKQYFSNELKMYPEYKRFDLYLQKKKVSNIGFFSHNDGWEYPIQITFFKNKSLRLHHVNVENSTSKLESKTEKVDCIVSTYKVGDSIIYNHQKYKLITPKNKILFIYANN